MTTGDDAMTTTTETTTWVGRTGYYINHADLLVLRRMAKAAHTSWQPLAARPALAAAWVACYREAGSLERALERVLERVANGTMPN
jgi:hypothetical protein